MSNEKLRSSVLRRGNVYLIKFDDGSKAFLAFKTEDNVVKLLETYVPPQHRGKGIAKLLVDKAVEDAEREGLSIEPICSYSVSYFITNRDKRSLLTEPYRSMSDEELRQLFQKRLEEEKLRKSTGG